MPKSPNRQKLNDGEILRPKSRNPKIEFDRLQMYFREPYVIDVENTEGQLTLYQPTIGDVIRIGQKRFFQTLHLLTTNTTQNRLMLWEQGLDWNDMSDFELFADLREATDPEVIELFFKDIHLTDFKKFNKKVEDGDVLVLYDQTHNIEIDENVYFHISQYIRAMFNIHPEEKITHDAILKKWYIDKNRRQLDIDKQKKTSDDDDSSLVAMVSAYVNHPGTKYKTSELRDVGVCEFYDSLQRLQIYEQSTALMKGLYGGMIDDSKIKADEYNFMREI